MRCAPPSARPGPRPWSAPSSPRTQSVSVSPPPGGEDAPSLGRRPFRSRRTLSANGKTRWVAAPVPHTDRKPGPCLKDGAVGRPPSPQLCSACALFSYVRSAILTDERFLHFQLRRDSRVSLRTMAERFQSFFVDRSVRGKAEENPNVVKPDVLSSRNLSGWERTIVDQPLHYISPALVVRVGEHISWAQRVWAVWSNQMRDELRRAA